MDSRSSEALFPHPSKPCRDCGRELPLEEFRAQADGASGRAPRCIACQSALWHRRYRAKNPVKQPKPVPPEKVCPRCGRTLPLEAFAPKTTARDGRSSHCRDCRNDAKRHYDETHKAERSEYQKRYYQENAETCGQRIRASIAKKPEKYQQIHSDWKKQNIGACRAMAHRRHARARSAGSWTQGDWERLKAQYDWRCLGCGRQEITDGIALCFDHVIPLSLGGWNIISNAQPLCRSCNSIKSRKVVDLRR